jgi:hypothetical protein
LRFRVINHVIFVKNLPPEKKAGNLVTTVSRHCQTKSSINVHCFLPLAVWETVSPNLVQKLQELQAIIMKDLE